MVYPFIGFNGDPRSGKTLGVTAVALTVAGNNGFILGNYFIDVPNFKMITPYDLVGLLDGQVMAKQRLRCRGEVVLALQEVYGWLNSHKSLSSVNDFESAFVFQASKLDYNIVWDSQIAMRVDSSLRDMTPYRFECEKRPNCFVYWLLDRSVPTKNVRVGKKFVIPVSVAATFWDKYNTHRGLLPLGYRDMVYAMEKLEPDLMNATIERQVEMLLTEENKKRFGFDWRGNCSRVAVEDALIQLGESAVFGAFVCNRLKLRTVKKASKEEKS